MNGTDRDSASASASKITSDDLAAVYRLAKQHDLAPLVSGFFYRNRITEGGEDLRRKLRQDELMSVYRHEQMRYAFEEICGIFDEANIPYIPLKGSVIRPYYPEESMRTSCDIDILIHEEDLERAISCLAFPPHSRLRQDRLLHIRQGQALRFAAYA